MKYSNDVLINLPRERVVELFHNPDNLPKWQPGLLSIQHQSGEEGQPGSKALMKYDMGKRGQVEMIETVIARGDDGSFEATYEAKGVWNLQKNRFETIGPNQTRYISESEFKMKGFMKLIAFFMPGAFKKQSQKYLEQFKAFAEKEG